MNRLICASCPDALRDLASESIDLTVTSPPYDNLRTSYRFLETDTFTGTVSELLRITKPGGVVVWVVSDATEDGSESGSSFRQALHFKDAGFRLHDTMIYGKKNPTPMNHRRYEQAFEYVFILSKGSPKTFNGLREPITSPRKERDDLHHSRNYQRGNGRRAHKTDKLRNNVWWYGVGHNVSTKDQEAFGHPALFPEALAQDHVLTWSDPGDVVLDPFCGSGTTLKAAAQLGRQFIGIDCEPRYVEISRQRLEKHGLI